MFYALNRTLQIIRNRTQCKLLFSYFLQIISKGVRWGIFIICAVILLPFIKYDSRLESLALENDLAKTLLRSPVFIRRSDIPIWREPCKGICSFWPSKEENMRLWLVDFIVGPSSRLLYSKGSPLLLIEKLSFVCYFLVDLFGEDNMPVLVVSISVFL